MKNDELAIPIDSFLLLLLEDKSKLFEKRSSLTLSFSFPN